MSLATYEAVAGACGDSAIAVEVLTRDQSVTTALLAEFDFEFEPEYIKTVPMALGTPQYLETLTLPMVRGRCSFRERPLRISPQKYPLMVIAKHRKQ